MFAGVIALDVVRKQNTHMPPYASRVPSVTNSWGLPGRGDALPGAAEA